MKNSNKKIPDRKEVYEKLNQTALRELREEGKTNTGYFKMKLDDWSDESLLELASLIIERLDKGGA